MKFGCRLLVVKMAAITDYFKSKKILNCVEEIPPSENLTFAQAFYKEQLTSNDECDNAVCIENKFKLKNTIAEIEKKTALRRNQIKFAQMIIFEKDIEIARLQKLMNNMQLASRSLDSIEKSTRSDNPSTPTVESAVEIDRVPTEAAVHSHNPMIPAVEPAIQCDCPPTEAAGNRQKLNFTNFSSIFEESQLADIRLIGPTKKEDSTFINVAMRLLYENRLDVLEKKSVTGRSKNNDKEKLTPYNVETIKQLFKERMQQAEPSEREARQKQVNKHIKDSIENITRSLKNTNVQRQLFKE